MERERGRGEGGKGSERVRRGVGKLGRFREEGKSFRAGFRGKKRKRKRSRERKRRSGKIKRNG